MLSRMSAQQRNCLCRVKKIIRKDDESPQTTALEVYFSQYAHIDALVIFKVSSTVADFICLNKVLETMIGVEFDHKLPDIRFLPQGHIYCESFLSLHPPCEFHTYDGYFKLLSSNFVPLLKRMCEEVRLGSEHVLPDAYSRHKVRRIYSEEYSEDIAECVEIITKVEENSMKTYSELYPLERLKRSFVPFTFIVNVIQQDMLLRNSCLQVSRDPLIKQVLWKDVHILDADRITNNLTRSIFDFYVQCWHNGIEPAHLKTVARLIEYMSQTVYLCKYDLLNHQTPVEAPSGPISLEKKLIDSPLIPFRGFTPRRTLDEIENGTRKTRPPPVAEPDNFENICSRFSSVLAISLKNRCSCDKKCEFLADAITFLKPVWLRLYVASSLLQQEPTVEAIKLCAEQHSSEVFSAQRTGSKLESSLRSILFSAAEEIFADSWRISHLRKEKLISKRAKLDPVLSKEEQDFNDLMDLLRKLTRN